MNNILSTDLAAQTYVREMQKRKKSNNIRGIQEQIFLLVLLLEI